jgi:hypothetical protein
MTYPNGADVFAFLKSVTSIYPPAVQCDEAAAAAAKEWEDRTGWLPFVSDGATLVQRYFDPPGSTPRQGRGGYVGGGRVLELDGGIVESSSVVVQYGFIPGPVLTGAPVSQGAQIVQNIQYYLRPENAEYQNKPYTWIDFPYRISGIPLSVAVRAKWGHQIGVPNDVWRAILTHAVSELAPEISLQISGGQAQVRRGDEEIRYSQSRGDTGPFAQQTGFWDPRWEKIIGRYVRVVV